MRGFSSRFLDNQLEIDCMGEYLSLCPRPPLARAIKRVEARGRPGITYHVRVERR